MKSRMILACALALASIAARADGNFIDVTTLGAKSDGSADISGIVNANTERGTLFFPVGRYKVSHPLRLRNPIVGSGYARLPRVDDTRTWLLSDISSTDGSAGVIEIGGGVPVSVEGLNIQCHSDECGIRVSGDGGNAPVNLNRVGVFELRGVGLSVTGAEPREVTASNMTVFAPASSVARSVALRVEGVDGCAFRNVEAMYVCIGLEILNAKVRGTNLHLWTGYNNGKRDDSWWARTRGLVLGDNADFVGSQIYPDTNYHAFEQTGTNTSCVVSDIMYWEDSTVTNVSCRDGAFVRRAADGSGRLVIRGGLVGVSGTDANPGAMSRYRSPGAEISGVILKSDYELKPENIDRLCWDGGLPDYRVDYHDIGFGKVADILTTAEAGACQAVVVRDDGAAWQLAVTNGIGGAATAAVEPLNALANAADVQTKSSSGHLKVFLRFSGQQCWSARVTVTERSGGCWPIDHGILRAHGDGTVRYRETLSTSGTVTWSYGGRGDWTKAGNWKNGTPPTALSHVVVDNGGTVRVGDGMDLLTGRIYFGSSSGKSGNIEMTGGRLALSAIATQVGAGAGGKGTFTMSGGELQVDQLQIGAHGTGSMTLSGGKVVSSDWCCIGRYPGGVGTMTITGAGVWECGVGKTTLFVSEEGTGQLVVENGGEFRVHPDCAVGCILGNQSPGRGELWLNPGGKVVAPGVDIRYEGNRFILNGGVLSANKEGLGGRFIYGKGTFEVGPYDGTIDTLGSPLNVEVAIDDLAGFRSRAIVKRGAGVLNLMGGGNFSGGFKVEEGTLAAAAPSNLPNFATAPLSVAGGATLLLGEAWSDSQALALTNRTGFAMASGAMFARRKTAGGDTVVHIRTGTVTADYALGELGKAHVVIDGGGASTPAYLRVLGETFTPPLATSGAGTLELGAYAGILPGVGPLTVDFFGDGRMLTVGRGGFRSTDLILGDRAGWPVTFANAVDQNGSGNFTLKARGGATLLCTGAFTNSTGKANFNFWGGNLVFGDVPGVEPDFHGYRFYNREGTVLFTNATIRMENDFCVGSDGTTSGKAVTILKDCRKTSSGGWDFVNGSTGTVFMIDGGSCAVPYQLNVGYLQAKKTGTLVMTNGAEVSIGTLCQFSGWVRQHSGTCTIGAAAMIGASNRTCAGSGPATYALHGGRLVFPDGKNFQIGAHGEGLLWQTGGEITASGYPCVGRYPGGVGEYRLHGGSFTMRQQDNGKCLFFVAEEGTGTVSIARGGVLVNQRDGGVQVCSKPGSRGVLFLSDGGTLETDRVVGGAAGEGTLVFNGGTLRARNGNHRTTFIQSTLTHAEVSANGGAIDTNGQGDFTLAKPLTAATVADTSVDGAVADPAFRKRGGGALTLIGANAYPCATAVDEGTLALAAGATLPPTEWRVAKGAALQLNATAQTAAAIAGEGTLRGGKVSVAGAIRPGGAGAVGALTLDGTELTSGTLEVDFDKAGHADRIDATGAIDLAKLSLRLADRAQPEPGRSYVLISAREVVGDFARCDLPEGWKVKANGGVVRLQSVGASVLLR